jgi:hypothetical protein
LFDVVWHSDLSNHCRSINQTLRLEQNGVRANAGQAWFGGAMNTIYDAGSSIMPSTAGPNGTFLNGGIPQLADRALIKRARTALLGSTLPSDFSGFGVCDIEYPGLYPLWSYDFGPDDQNVRKLATNWTSSHHPHLSGAALLNQTMADFNTAMKELWQLQLDPFSPCNGKPEFGDELTWLWQSERGHVFPGSYFNGATSRANNSARMISVVREAVRVAQVHGHGRPAVMPFVSYAYRGGGPLDHTLLPASMMWQMLSVPASLGVHGVVIWGGSGDAVECDALSQAFDEIGPKLKALRSELAQCAESSCSGQGRCASWYKPRCVCEAKRTGDMCEHQRTNVIQTARTQSMGEAGGLRAIKTDEVVDVGTAEHLLLWGDAALTANMTGLTAKAHQPVKTGIMAVVPDRPWERLIYMFVSLQQLS